MRNLEADLAEIVGPEPEPLKPALRVVTKADGQWERCKDWIEAGLEGSPLTLADVKHALDADQALLWPGKGSAIVTEFIDYPSGERSAHVMSAGGNLQEIRQMIPGVESFARLNGASTAIIEGRRGWERALKGDGYLFLAVTLQKRI
jgi:hypothetical protein